MSGPRPGASGTCGNLIERQILGPLPRLPEPETLGWSPAELRVLTSPPGVSDGHSSLRTIVLGTSCQTKKAGRQLG